MINKKHLFYIFLSFVLISFLSFKVLKAETITHIYDPVHSSQLPISINITQREYLVKNPLVDLPNKTKRRMFINVGGNYFNSWNSLGLTNFYQNQTYFTGSDDIKEVDLQKLIDYGFTKYVYSNYNVTYNVEGSNALYNYYVNDNFILCRNDLDIEITDISIPNNELYYGPSNNNRYNTNNAVFSFKIKNLDSFNFIDYDLLCVQSFGPLNSATSKINNTGTTSLFLTNTLIPIYYSNGMNNNYIFENVGNFNFPFNNLFTYFPSYNEEYLGKKMFGIYSNISSFNSQFNELSYNGKPIDFNVETPVITGLQPIEIPEGYLLFMRPKRNQRTFDIKIEQNELLQQAQYTQDTQQWKPLPSTSRLLTYNEDSSNIYTLSMSLSNYDRDYVYIIQRALGETKDKVIYLDSSKVEYTLVDSQDKDSPITLGNETFNPINDIPLGNTGDIFDLFSLFLQTIGTFFNNFIDSIRTLINFIVNGLSSLFEFTATFDLIGQVFTSFLDTMPPQIVSLINIVWTFGVASIIIKIITRFF